MRNIFDQYSQQENRLTHALICALSEDPALKRDFLKWILPRASLPKEVSIVEQQLVDEEAITEQEAEARGLPDAWFFDNEKWSLLIESKVAAPLKKDQLIRHYKTAQKRGFENITVLTITLNPPTMRLPDFVLSKTWAECYLWLKQKENTSTWATTASEYFEVADSTWASEGYMKEGTLTVFTGVPFNKKHPYNYREAKLYLKQAMNELRCREKLERELGAELSVSGRGAIKGSQAISVWDFIPLIAETGSENIKSHPHITLSIGQENLSAIAIIPNGIKKSHLRNITDFGENEFREVLRQVYRGLKPVLRKSSGAQPILSLQQRHWPTRNSEAVVDARLEVDLRTMANGGRISKVKQQPEWISAAYSTLTNKASNLTFSIGVRFPYTGSNVTNSPEILDLIMDAWIACRPLIEQVYSER